MSMREARISAETLEGPAEVAAEAPTAAPGLEGAPMVPSSLKMDSITESSVEVVSAPQNPAQSLTMRPAPRTSEPRFTVPATRGT